VRGSASFDMRLPEHFGCSRTPLTGAKCRLGCWAEPAPLQEKGSFDTGCPSWTPCPFESHVLRIKDVAFALSEEAARVSNSTATKDKRSETWQIPQDDGTDRSVQRKIDS
jgi:hypothetical protein